MLSSLGSHAKELKQQGAVEAVQDENTKVTAQDAEDVLVKESKKGGAAAFQFDPNATPEQKAAQAGAVRILLDLPSPGPLLMYRTTASSRWLSSPEKIWSWYRN
jgi:hypothetical protein